MTSPTGPVRGGGRFLSLATGDESRLAGLGVLVAVGLAQLADLVTFVRLMAVHGVAAELNPLVAHGFDQLGLVPLVASKVALVVLIGAAFVIVARSRPRLSTAVASTGMIAGLLGAYSNIAAL